jgi:hypothetical protein
MKSAQRLVLDACNHGQLQLLAIVRDPTQSRVRLDRLGPVRGVSEMRN